MSGNSNHLSGKLAVQRPDGSVEDVALSKSPILVGRLKSNDIVILGDSAISREHCRFDVDSIKAELTVRDLGSSNGTFINGESVGALPIPMKTGDKVQVGSTLLVLSIDPPPVVQETKVPEEKRRFGVPLSPQPGEEERLDFSEDECICGRCGSSISIEGLEAGDKVGCVCCRAVWRIP